MHRDPHVLQRLGVQLGFTVALVTSLVFGFTVWTEAQQGRETLTRELTLRLLSKSRSLALAAAAPLLTHDPELGLHPLVTRALAETPELVGLVVLDSRRRIQGTTDMQSVGAELPPRQCRRVALVQDGDLPAVDHDRAGPRLHRARERPVDAVVPEQVRQRRSVRQVVDRDPLER